MSMKMLLLGLKYYYANADDCERIIISHALASAAAVGVGGIIPGLAILAIIAGCFASVWAMYIALAKKLELTLSDDLLKIIPSAVISNIASNLASVLAIHVVLSFIPGLSIAAAATITWLTVWLAGKTFLLIILQFAKSGRPIEQASKEDIEKSVRENAPTRDDVREAKQARAANS